MNPLRIEYNIGHQREVTRRDYTQTTRLWVKFPRCSFTWQWAGLTENVGDAEHMIERSACGCGPTWSGGVR